jgi:hypothetical protein
LPSPENTIATREPSGLKLPPLFVPLKLASREMRRLFSSST